MHTVRDLRTSFLQFFRDRDHRVVPSSPLLPKDDPTLLFTTAGMVQFKPMFAGTVDLEYTRAATVQKCLRTSDLENVGRTKRHLTFFEMLGNFSFGDYFKKEAIEFAWDYSTKVIGFPVKDIWVSIYEDDNEAFDLWHERIGVPAEKIVRLGKADNFWGPAGDTGACGPCSELYLDRGPDYGCGSPDCKPGCECERFLEYWNLVFNQFNQDINGKLNPLPRTGIDTGMGLERLATLVQKVDSVFDTDELKGLVQMVSKHTGRGFEGASVVPISVIVEHARALTFAMSDGIYPSNDGRGYVLRRILRRALRFTRQIGVTEPYLYTLVDPIVAAMSEFYPELRGSAPNVKKVIESEEQRFLETIENGLDRLDETMKSLKKKGGREISGKDAFVLYDTFGFPLEMTVEIAEEQGLGVNTGDFEKEMQEQRERGKQSWKGGDSGYEKAFEQTVKTAGDTEFTGYTECENESVVVAVHDGTAMKDALKQGESGFIVLNRTPLYGESGGQVGDTGEIVSSKGRFAVHETKKYNRTIFHVGVVEEGSFSKGDTVTARYNVVRRNLTRANHSVTHLLQAALRSVLGDHVKQAGSLVEPDRMRFDFSHFKAMSGDEIARVEDIVNEKIWENIPVETEMMPLDAAIKSGAMAEFGEKYEDVVRVVKVPGFSMELCGGTHVDNTGKIGVFKIIREASPGAGVRRIEGLTLKGVLRRYNDYSGMVSTLSQKLNINEAGLLKRVEDLQERTRTLEKELEKQKKESLSGNIDGMLGKARDVKGVKIVAEAFNGTEVDDLRALSDSVRSKEQVSVVLFGSQIQGKAMLMFAATGKAVEKGIDCGRLIREVAPLVSGGGGGRKDMAQAGGKDPAGLERALAVAVEKASEMLK